MLPLLLKILNEHWYFYVVCIILNCFRPVSSLWFDDEFIKSRWQDRVELSESKQPCFVEAWWKGFPGMPSPTGSLPLFPCRKTAGSGGFLPHGRRGGGFSRESMISTKTDRPLSSRPMLNRAAGVISSR